MCNNPKPPRACIGFVVGMRMIAGHASFGSLKSRTPKRPAPASGRLRLPGGLLKSHEPGAGRALCVQH
jgi:hypothetical protein